MITLILLSIEQNYHYVSLLFIHLGQQSNCCASFELTGVETAGIFTVCLGLIKIDVLTPFFSFSIPITMLVSALFLKYTYLCRYSLKEYILLSMYGCFFKDAFEALQVTWQFWVLDTHAVRNWVSFIQVSWMVQQSCISSVVHEKNTVH